MRRVAGEEDTPVPVHVRYHVARNPAPHVDDLVRYPLADDVREHATGVHLLGRVVEFLAAYAEAVEFAPVEDDEVAPQPLRLDETDERGLAHAVMLPQRRSLHEDRKEMAGVRRAAHARSEERRVGKEGRS